MSLSEQRQTPKAWGKIILAGEHAVVYGHTALAGAITRGLSCRARPCTGGSRLLAPDWHLDVAQAEDHPVARAMRVMLEAADRSDIIFHVDGDLPAAAGLGSSAALCVAMARALVPGIDGERLVQLANLGEQCFHERPSGVDVALSSQGGFGVYQRASGLRQLPCAALPIVVGLSGQARRTAAMVSGVAERMKSSAQVREGIDELGRLAKDAETALIACEHEALGSVMNACQVQLERIGVSIAILDAMIAAARSAGALGAKLTGAGGGGAIIALAPGREEAVMKALADLGHQSFVTTVGARQ